MIAIKDISYLPESPGCYLFYDISNIIIYVGKAKNIKKRVSSYFQKKEHDNKTKALVEKIHTIDFITTKTEVDALLLENNLIKKHYPKYNLDLKDSRRYAYIRLVPDTYPYLEVARVRDGKGEYYGPFISGTMRKIVFDVITRTFRILSRKASKKLKNLIEPERYQERLAIAKKILKGNVDEIITDLTISMKKASLEKNFEYAVILRNQINALEMLKEKQHIEMTKVKNVQIIAYRIIAEQVYLLVFTIRNGVLEDKEDYSFEYYEDFFENFISQLYDFSIIPEELIVQANLSTELIDFLEMKRGKKVTVSVPERGEKKELLNLVENNVMSTFFAGSDRVISLKELLSLEKSPTRIECFDISHLGGTNTVASMVVFDNGLPDKSSYRKFKIQTVSDGDDYMAMKEVVSRRYGGSLKSTMKQPNLIVVDGGKGQLEMAKRALEALNLNITVISLAKRLEEVYTLDKDQPILADRKNKGLQLLQALRDEAHRFAITYQRSLRSRQIQTPN